MAVMKAEVVFVVAKLFYVEKNELSCLPSSGIIQSCQVAKLPLFLEVPEFS